MLSPSIRQSVRGNTIQSIAPTVTPNITPNSIAWLLPVILLASLLFASAGLAQDQQSPRQLVQDFYTWYFKTEKQHGGSEFGDEIYKYMSEKTVETGKNVPDGMYFTKSYSHCCSEDKLVLIVHDPISVANYFLVPVDFKGINVSVLACVVKEKQGLRIIKIMDAAPCEYDY